MRKLLLTFVALAILGSAWATNKERLTFEKGQNQLKVENITTTGFNFNLKIGEAFLNDVESKNGDFFILQAEGFTKSFHIGNPNLPTKSKLIEVPFGANVNVKVVSSKFEIIDLNAKGFSGKLMPCQPSVAKCDDGSDLTFEFNEKAYSNDAFYANDLVKFEESGIMRGTRLGRIEMNPFQYNPVKNQLKVYTELTIEVTFEGADMAKTERMKDIYGNGFFNNLLTKTMNYTNDAKPLNQNEPVKMIIIADRMFEASLADFVDWKNMTGIETIVRYTDEGEVGNTTTSIKSYLQGVYDAATTENPAPTFVLLVGDIQQVPAFPTTVPGKSHITDLFYFTYDGASDLIPDVNYGRFSAQTVAQLDIIIGKTLLYEKYEMTDPSYLDNVVLVAGDDESNEDVFGNGAINYIHDIYMNEAHGLTPFVYLQDPPTGQSNSTYSAEIIQHVSDGIAWGNYTAHCSPSGWATPSFTTSDIPGLQNSEKYGLLIGNCCLSNKFDDNECFGEALLRTADKGAIGYIGGSNSTYWDEDYWWATGNGSPVENPNYEDFGNGCYDLMYHENITDQPYDIWAPTQSQVNLAGQLAVEESSSTRKTYYWEIYHLMGDPSLMPWVGVPDAITPSYLSSIPVGLGSLSISGMPEYARIALSDGGTLVATAVADASGNATLEFTPFANPTTADLVITAQWHHPYMGTLGVVPGDEPFIVLNEYTVNGNTAYGEAVTLDLNMKNVAEAGSGYDATDLEVTLSTDDTYVTITDATETYGTINAGDSATVANGFGLNFANNIPDQHNVLFTVTTTGVDAKYTWESSLTIAVDAPSLSVGGMIIDDSGSGNGDNILDPGETANFILTINNDGASDIDNVNSTFTINSGADFLTFSSNTAVVGAIAAGGSATATFEVTADAGTPLGTAVDMTNNVTGGASDQYTTAGDEQIIIGFVPEYCESGSTNSSDSDLTNFEFGDLTNNTEGDCGQYDDFTEDPDLIHEFMIGASYDVSVTLGTCGGTYTKGAKVFVDWNYDGDFDDEGETAFSVAPEDNDWTASGTITIPADAPAGIKFVRVIVEETSDAISPCGTFSWGGTEDYKIILVAPEPPVADFSATPTETTVGMNVAFTDITTNAPTSWNWTITPGAAGTDFEFINGTVNTSQNPVVQFNTANLYTVALTSTNMVDSDTETKADYITINEVTEVPVANFTADVTDLLPGKIVHFTDMSNNSPTGWQWTVTPGVEGTEFDYVESTSSTSQNPSIQFNTEGYYTIELIASNEIGSSDPYSEADMINVMPVFNMQNGTITTCNGVFFDTGGPDEDYGSSEALTLTIYPEETGTVSKVEFIKLETETDYDYLTIYDGEDTSASEIGSYSGNNDGLTVIATNDVGALTFVFESDGSVVDLGWEANISCVSSEVYMVTFEVTSNNAGIEGAVISCAGEDPMTTDADGHASMEMHTGTYEYTVIMDGYADVSGTFDVVDAPVTVPINMVGMNDIQAASLKLYPNPTNGNVTVELPHMVSGATAVVLDLTGKTIVAKQFESATTTLDLSAVSEGIYIIKVQNGNMLYTNKIIVK